MKKSLQRYLLYLSIPIFVRGGTTGCDLSGPPQSALSEGEIFGNSRLVEVYMDDLHKAMGHGLHEIMVASLTDESHFIHGYGTREAINLQIIPSYLGVWQDDRIDDYQWGELYSIVPGSIGFLKI